MTGKTEQTKPEQRIRIERLIPAEMVFAGVVFITLGCTIAVWTGRNLMRDAALRYQAEPLWTAALPTVIEQPNYIDQERARRKELLAAAQKTGTGYTQALIALGNVYLGNGKWELAYGCFNNALKSVGKNSTDQQVMTTIYFALGHASLQIGNVNQSIHWLQLAKTAASSAQPSSNVLTHILEDLAIAYSQSDNLVAAKRCCTQLVTEVSARRADDPNLIFWKCQIGDLERRMKDDVAAETVFRVALIDLAGRPGDNGPNIARTRFGLALCCAHQGDVIEANRNYKLALAQAQTSEGLHSPLVESIRRAYAYSLWKTNWIAAVAMTFASEGH